VGSKCSQCRQCSRSIHCLTYFDLLPHCLHLDPIHQLKLVVRSRAAEDDRKRMQADATEAAAAQARLEGAERARRLAEEQGCVTVLS
jgi:hypothetical protein